MGTLTEKHRVGLVAKILFVAVVISTFVGGIMLSWIIWVWTVVFALHQAKAWGWWP